ncbi:hypothetical protein ES319_D05G224400v1 [Gossypium barbadense]|uniref:J domain-containing protein n=5 Tax=Gossypium TaxID=3633 RepID=A0A5J5RL63_GOSBA|nr:hypothetical protein ES319_D05G224400v1 [Gossypium barbadense]TYG69502.1 hypothetical protein ES288_D05G235600v1 [Gossypium darwinii]TYH72142.1 hypothetical protein ES332_D05G234300v1 [Gossypium tomentosum]
MGSEDADSDKSKQWSSPNRAYKGKEEDPKLWGLFLFGLIGATATTFAVSQLRKSVDWMFAQLARSQSSQRGGSFRTSFQEEAWRRYNRRLQEEYEEEMERVERIRRMQSVFNRERNKYRRSYESWRENGPGAYHQHYQRDDWYWKAEAQFRDQRTNFRQPQRDSASYPLSHHYSVLGLDRSRTQPYTEDEIKTAFRAKAKQFHPDQNQNNKEAAEAKFKEVMTSYEAIKQERKNMRA